MDNGGTVFASIVIFVILLFVYAAGGCSVNPAEATKALEDMNFHDVEIYGGSIGAQYTCGDDYTFATKFAAKNVNGSRVTGVVCSGWLKGKSVKLD